MKKGAALKKIDSEDETRCILITFTSTFPTWKEREENIMKAYKLTDKIELLLRSYDTEIAKSIFLHFGYCDFRKKKCKTPLRFSYSVKERQIRVTFFVNYALLRAVDDLDSETFLKFYEILLLDSIIAGSKKYQVPEKNYKALLQRRSKLGQIPEWIPEMETNPQLVIDLYKASVPKPK